MDIAPAALDAVSAYYTGTLRRFGATPRGADWPHRLNQDLRFAQLLKGCDFDAPFSLNDVGCGYGALRGFLGRRHRRAAVDYAGTDVSAAMVAAARRRWRHRADCQFEHAAGATRVADWSVASGIFHVKLGCPLAEWETLVANTLDNLRAHSRLGFAINFLQPPRPGVASPPELYRPDGARWAHYLRTRCGNGAVTLLHDYGLPEITLQVRLAP